MVGIALPLFLLIGLARGAHIMTKKVQKKSAFFVNADNRTWPVKAISFSEIKFAEEAVVERARNAGKQVDVPTYKVPLGDKSTGAFEPIELTENNLVVEGDEEETLRRQIAWQEYQTTWQEIRLEQTNISREIMLDGIDVKAPDPEQQADHHWVKRMKKYGIPIPDDDDERDKLFKLTEVLKTPACWVAAQSAIIEEVSSGVVSKDQLAAAGKMFLDSLQKTSS